ncbi:MAG: lytic transglycosylase domain-containing protein [Gemmatimonadaceae bacterium]|nr:lytic transglycosylase domain-containing protein [Gemmatimonadaceae bacterium]
MRSAGLPAECFAPLALTRRTAGDAPGEPVWRAPDARLLDMHDLRGTYVHRGDNERLRRRFRRWIIAGGALVSVGMAARRPVVLDARAEAATPVAASSSTARVASLADRLHAATTARKATQRLQRWNKIYTLAHRWMVDTELARAIHDAAVEAGLDPELAFRVVNVESQFKEHATSHVGAAGLTQVMLPTARYYDRNITKAKLYERETNLRIGFHYLRDLIDERRGNVKLALLTYNRGGLAVETELSLGLDPSNGYDTKVMRGYKGAARIRSVSASRAND